jgi:hypothetical protein
MLGRSLSIFLVPPKQEPVADDRENLRPHYLQAPIAWLVCLMLGVAFWAGVAYAVLAY